VADHRVSSLRPASTEPDACCSSQQRDAAHHRLRRAGIDGRDHPAYVLSAPWLVSKQAQKAWRRLRWLPRRAGQAVDAATNDVWCFVAAFSPGGSETSYLLSGNCIPLVRFLPIGMMDETLRVQQLRDLAQCAAAEILTIGIGQSRSVNADGHRGLVRPAPPKRSCRGQPP
jgi:hypothetical protein